jgi:uncharacterized protein (UPF0333 family)
MTEKKKEDLSKREVKGKNFVVLIPFVVVVAIVFAIGVGVKDYEASKKIASNTTNKTLQQKWELCWSDAKTKKNRCGVVKKIVFANEEVVFMDVYYSCSSVTTKFHKRKNDKRGTWEQPSGKGWWTLKKINPNLYEGKCQGSDKGAKIRQLVLSLQN